MLRYLLIAVFMMASALLVLQGRRYERRAVKPLFLQEDKIAASHTTSIRISVNSLYRPDTVQLARLRQDYSNLWAHLNHLYQTNDVEAGREYYTEAWFKQINHHYRGAISNAVKRTDLQHELHIRNWSPDGLACSLTDSNLVLQYQYPEGGKKTSRAHLQLQLLYQGDHWRIDAIRLLNESPF